jgi:hypothetical protein
LFCHFLKETTEVADSAKQITCFSRRRRPGDLAECKPMAFVTFATTFRGLLKKLGFGWFWEGHDFRRTVRPSKINPALAAEGRLLLSKGGFSAAC